MAHRTRIQGADELDRLLVRLPRAIRRQPFANAARKGGRVIRDEMKSQVAVREGTLQDSITTATVRMKDAVGDVTIRIGSTLFRAPFQEYGTRFQPARPFVRPAGDVAEGDAIAAIVRELARGIAKTAKRLAGPLSRRQRRRIFR